MSGLHTSLLVQSVLDGLSYYMGWEPTILFHGADAATRDSLVGLLDTAAEHRRSAMAAALAWVGDDRVYELFSAWLVLPPPWVPEPTAAAAQRWLLWQLDGPGGPSTPAGPVDSSTGPPAGA